MGFELAIFDVTGTTVLDGNAAMASLHQALWQNGIDVSEAEVAMTMGLPKSVAIARLIAAKDIDLGDGLAGTIAQINDDLRVDLTARFRFGGNPRPAPYAISTFNALRRAGIRVALATGLTRDVLDALLERIQWREGETFDLSIASDEVDRSRPYPDLIYYAMARLRIGDTARVVKIGDTLADLAEGRAARCGLVVGVTYGNHTRQQMNAADVHLIDSLTELLPLLGVTPILTAVE